MDVLDRLRPGEGQKIVVALEKAFAAVEAVAAEMTLVEAKALDLRPIAPSRMRMRARAASASARAASSVAAGGASKNCVGLTLMARIRSRPDITT
jgi:hypothetical protein